MNEVFQNLPINIEELPKVSEVDFQPIEKAYLKVSIINQLIFLTILSVGALSIIYFSDIPNKYEAYMISGLVIIALIVFSLLMTIFGFKKKKFALREKDIMYTKGLIWSVRTAIPFNRVQHAEIKQGPLERLMKLSSLKIFTAGGQSSDLVIPGLTNEKAQEIKDFILGKTSTDAN